ncbi:MAG: type II toxin-antitoxin system RatA family toxin [Methyloprofundus sp.]|nr:type II toxin-antitoxin system RatA family toxin [Methyloprofundus sp.]
MATVEKSALIKYSAQQMFDLVDDIASYPDFLPWCMGSEVMLRKGNIVEAKVQISKGGFKNAFATRNVNQAGESIAMSLLEGPFSSLEGVWRFLPLREDASKISLDLEFEMNGMLANLAFGAVFNQICNTMVTSFTDRAKQVYGV